LEGLDVALNQEETNKAISRRAASLVYDEGPDGLSVGWTDDGNVYVLYNNDRPEAVLTSDEIKTFLEGR
jgi:hypothetical protein